MCVCVCVRVYVYRLARISLVCVNHWFSVDVKFFNAYRIQGRNPTWEPNPELLQCLSCLQTGLHQGLISHDATV